MIRGVLFDSADVLMRPPREHETPWKRWFPCARFEELAGQYPPERLDAALEHGMELLDARHPAGLASIEEERDLFSEFYEAVLSDLEAPDPQLAGVLARDQVDEARQAPYEDVQAALERLRNSGLRLGVLSEAWPSLELRYAEAGLRDFFDAFVVSALEGRLKDDPALFATAAEQLGLRPEEILFVDDHEPHVRTAEACGFHGLVLDRSAGEGLARVIAVVAD